MTYIQQYINNKYTILLKYQAQIANESYQYFDQYIHSIPRDRNGQLMINAQTALNNDVDAFRHAYTSGIVLFQYESALVANILGQLNEWQGDKKGQPAEQKNMDLYNNKIGRDYAVNVLAEYDQQFLDSQLDDSQMGPLLPKKMPEALFKERFGKQLQLSLENGEMIESADQTLDDRQYRAIDHSVQHEYGDNSEPYGAVHGAELSDQLVVTDDNGNHHVFNILTDETADLLSGVLSDDIGGVQVDDIISISDGEQSIVLVNIDANVSLPDGSTVNTMDYLEMVKDAMNTYGDYLKGKLSFVVNDLFNNESVTTDEGVYVSSNLEKLSARITTELMDGKSLDDIAHIIATERLVKFGVEMGSDAYMAITGDQLHGAIKGSIVQYGITVALYSDGMSSDDYQKAALSAAVNGYVTHHVSDTSWGSTGDGSVITPAGAGVISFAAVAVSNLLNDGSLSADEVVHAAVAGATSYLGATIGQALIPVPFLLGLLLGHWLGEQL